MIIMPLMRMIINVFRRSFVICEISIKEMIGNLFLPPKSQKYDHQPPMSYGLIIRD